MTKPQWHNDQLNEQPPDFITQNDQTFQFINQQTLQIIEKSQSINQSEK